MKKIITVISIVSILGLSGIAWAGDDQEDNEVGIEQLQAQVERLSAVVDLLSTQMTNQQIQNQVQPQQTVNNAPIAVDSAGVVLGKVIETFTARAATDYIKVIDSSNTIMQISVDGQLVPDETTSVVFVAADCTGTGYTSSFNNKTSYTIISALDGTLWKTTSLSYVYTSMASYRDTAGNCTQFTAVNAYSPQAMTVVPYTGQTTFVAPVMVKY